MGFLSKLRHQDNQPEQICPRCALPAAANSTECPECGWDLREAYPPLDAVRDADPA
jgi:hypothetical protein